MRTAAVFVDAGYLFSGGSDLLFGQTHRRRDLRIEDPAGLIVALSELAVLACEGEPVRVLRTYWYDGALNGIPSPEQEQIGDLSKVKLRLGRVTGGGQKGVDGLIILDLITLATNRAIDTAVLVSGDEDLREAAVHSQAHGVSLVLVGMPPTARQRQSHLLVREADHHHVLEAELLQKHLQLSPPSAPELAVEVSITGGVTVSTSAVDDVTAMLVEIAESLLSDARFVNRSSLFDPLDGPAPRLTREADRVLIARLSERTGVFPVDQGLLRSARRMLIDIASRAD